MTERNARIQKAREMWHLGNIPPSDSAAVGKFFVRLWEIARKEKINKLGMHKRFTDLHKEYRGKRSRMKYPDVGLNPVFKTIHGHTAMLTEKTPIAEVRSEETPGDLSIKAIDKDIRAWWRDNKMQFSLFTSVLGMGIYGTTIEKAIWNKDNDAPEIVVKDQYSFFPAPGYKMCDIKKLPYCCDAFLMSSWEVRKKFNIPPEVIIPTSDERDLFGQSRETIKGGLSRRTTDTSHYASNYAVLDESNSPEYGGNSIFPKTLIVEVWVVDKSVRKEPIYAENQSVMDETTGEPVRDDMGREVTGRKQIGERIIPNYLDGIRKVTICPQMVASGKFGGVLDDSPNPSINWELVSRDIQTLTEVGIPTPVMDEAGNVQINPEIGQPIIRLVPVPREEAINIVVGLMEPCYLWGRFPYNSVPSLVDTSQWWGFSIIEQIEELSFRAVGLLKRYLVGIDRALFPMMINPKGSGISIGNLENMPGIVLNPTAGVANLIRFVDQPPPHRTTLEFIEFLLMMIDIISMSPEVTEGRRPKGISAAAAIIALQEKAASLFQPQIRNVDSLVEARGYMYISLVQNFSIEDKQAIIDEKVITYNPSKMRGNIKYIVESGSSAPITKIGRRQQYVELFKLGALDLESLLEMLEIPNAGRIVERLAEQRGLEKAIDVLIQAGLPEEIGMELFQELIQDQGGTGRGKKAPAQGKAGERKQVAGPPKGSSEGVQEAYKQMEHSEGA